MSQFRFLSLILVVYLSCSSVVYAQDAAFQELWSTPSEVLDLDVSKDGSLVAIINHTGVYVFNAETSGLVWSDEPPIDVVPLQVALSADGEGAVVLYQVVGEPPRVVLVYYDSVGNDQWTYIEEGIFDNLPNVLGMTSKILDISDDGDYVALALNLQDLSALLYWNESSTYTGPDRDPKWISGMAENFYFTCMDLSDDGNLVATGVTDNSDSHVFFYPGASNPALEGANPATSGKTELTTQVNDVSVSYDGYAAAAVTPGEGDYLPATLYYWTNVPSLGGESQANWTRQHGFRCVDVNMDGDVVVSGTFPLEPCGVHYWSGALPVDGISDYPEDWTRHNGEPIYDISVSETGDIVAATALRSPEEYYVYFHDGEGNTLGEFPVGEEDIYLESSGDGKITAVGGGEIRSLHVYRLTEMEPDAVGGELTTNTATYRLRIILAATIPIIVVATALRGSKKRLFIK